MNAAKSLWIWIAAAPQYDTANSRYAVQCSNIKKHQFRTSLQVWFASTNSANYAYREDWCLHFCLWNPNHQGTYAQQPFHRIDSHSWANVQRKLDVGWSSRSDKWRLLWYSACKRHWGNVSSAYTRQTSITIRALYISYNSLGHPVGTVLHPAEGYKWQWEERHKWTIQCCRGLQLNHKRHNSHKLCERNWQSTTGQLTYSSWDHKFSIAQYRCSNQYRRLFFLSLIRPSRWIDCRPGSSRSGFFGKETFQSFNPSAETIF